MNQKSPSKNGSVILLALFRLALLVGPETAIMTTLRHNPVVCVAAGVAVLALWLSVDVWPFRANVPKTAADPAPARQAQPAFPRNFAKAQWWSFLFCKALLLCAMLHSKLTI